MASEFPTRRSGAARFWARHEVATRWRALLLLGILAGAAGGVAIAAGAGARRTDTAFARFKAATGSPDAIVFGTQVGAHAVDYTPVERLPEVAGSGLFALAAIGSKEHPGLSGLAPADDHLYRTVARPLLVAGRLPDPHRVDEVLVNRRAASRYHLRVGDPFTIVTSNDINAFYGQAPMQGGPTIHAHVVGIGDGTMDQLFSPDDPGFTPSAALLARYGVRNGYVRSDGAPATVPRGRIEMATNLVVRLRPGTDAARFHRDVASALGSVISDESGNRVVPASQIPIRDLAEDDKRVIHATDLEQIGLLLFAAAAALASAVLVGQAVARFVYAQAQDAPTLRGLGLRRSETVRGLVGPHLVVAGVGTVVATVVAVALSPLFPVGLAGRLDPHKGVHLDAAVVVTGALLVALLVLATAAYAGGRASSAGRERRARRPSALGRAARAVLPVPVGLGAGLAVERGSGPRALPTRPAIVGAVAAVTGLVGCFGLLHGIDDALRTPARSGQVWDAAAFITSNHDFDATRTAVAHDRNVVAAGILERADAVVDGKQIPLYALAPLRGRNPFAVVSGRLPRSAHEIAIGPATARALHRGLGDTVRVRLTEGTDTVTVTGLALLPQTPHSSFDQGSVMTPAGLTPLAGAPKVRYESSVEEVDVVARFRRNPKAAAAALHRRTGVEVDPSTTPQDVLNLGNVRPLPRALAAFLVILGVAALGHALVTSVRRRRHELAVLRAIGFTPRQTAVVVAAQAGTVALIALAVGIPLGIVLGRVAWRWVANATPLVFQAPVAVAVVLLAVPATIVVANLLAAAPARHAARIRPAVALRAE